MKLIYGCDDPATPAEVGGKAAALARLRRASLPIPPWFVIAPQAYEQRDQPHVGQAIAAALRDLPGDGPLAVRSSAVDEDGADHSFAGQLESYLFVAPDQVLDRVADVWASGFSERVLAYRREHGLSATPIAPAVIVQRMIDADVSGVAFAADPIGGSRSTVVISALFGLGTALVGGDAEADTYRLSHTGESVETRIARKSIRHVAAACSPEGVRCESVPDERADRPALSAAQQKRVADLVLAVSRLEKRPQDIEWAIRDDELYLLQSRPITSLASVADPAGRRALWDNSNIAESYNGITTPLTFSFAQRAYQGAYRQFCRLMKVPPSVIADNEPMFAQMLGLIRGRIYYNLFNWYRLLALLPGYSVNQRFMEQMMGVREGLPAEVTSGIASSTWSQRQKGRLRFVWSAGGLLWNHFVLPRKIKAFYARLDEALAPPDPPLAQMRLDQLTAEFRRLESRLLSRWDAPLINDFLAMIFFGVLGKLCAKWLGPSHANLHNDLITDEGGIISAEPAQRIQSMGSIAAESPALTQALCDGDLAEAERQMESAPRLREEYRAYLEKFGDRCLEELKLESSTLVDDPTPLVRAIGHTAARLRSDEPPRQQYHPRQQAEQAVKQALKRRPLRRMIFGWVLRNARQRVRDRENLRFERTRLFGRVRRIFVEAGRRMMAEGLLRDERDMFYLTVDEVLGFVEGTSCDEGLGAVAGRRIEQFSRYRALPAPADRFETRGAVYLGNTFTAQVPPAAASGDGELRGMGCCPGVVTGRVRLIRDPRGAHLRQGEILVAERTDPGWIMLFPAAAGVLVERGSLLSHSAIVARELGIPAIVSIPDLMRSLTDGQLVEMNGATGAVRIVEGSPA
jgi:rifampicin phosphotransferase